MKRKPLPIKKSPLPILLVCLAFSLCGCDPGGTALVEIANKTPLDVHISFMKNEEKTYYDPGNYDDVAVKSNESATLRLVSLGGYRNPNEEIDGIIFTDMNTGEVIKELYIHDGNVFTFIKSEKKGLRIIAYFSLTLLEKNDIEGYIIF